MDVLTAIAAVVLLAILAAGVRAIVRAAESDRRRARRLASLAEEQDWAFSPQVLPVDVQEFKPFAVFIRGTQRYVLNTFDCSAPTRHGRARVRMGGYRTTDPVRTARGREIEHMAQFSYLLADLPFDTGGRLLVRPQGVFDAIASAFGAQDVDFESAEFNRRFLVRASSRRFAFDVLHPGTIELLSRTEPLPLVIEGRRICITDADSRWTAALFQSKLAWLRAFVDALATHVSAPAS